MEVAPLFCRWHLASPACHNPLGSGEVRQGGVVAIPTGPQSTLDGSGVQEGAGWTCVLQEQQKQ